MVPNNLQIYKIRMKYAKSGQPSYAGLNRDESHDEPHRQYRR